MANRDQDDSQYNRSEGRFDNRDDQGWQDQSNRGSREWDRHSDDWRGSQSRGYGEQFSQRGGRAQQFGDDSSSYNDRNLGGGHESSRIGAYDRGQYDRGTFDRQRGHAQDWNRSVGSQFGGPHAQSRDWGHAPQGGGYAAEWRSYPQDWSDRGHEFSRSRGFGGQGDQRHQDPFLAQERNRQEWNRTFGGGRAASYGQPSYGTSNYGQASHGRDDESWGDQIRHAGEQVVSRVKRAFRGPKGYKRSDERIREDVNDRLAQQYDFDPSDVEVQVANGEVTLTGTVRSRHEKFIAEEIADDVSGVNEVHNQIRVRRDDLSQASGSSSTTTSSASAQSDVARHRNSPRA
jgi:hypothetical protein